MGKKNQVNPPPPPPITFLGPSQVCLPKQVRYAMLNHKKGLHNYLYHAVKNK